MRCADCRDALSVDLDGELTAAESREIRDHLETCPDCRREQQMLADTSRLIKANLMRYRAPDVLRARIKSALADPNAVDRPIAPRRAGRGAWARLLAAGVVIAAASSAITLAAVSRESSSARLTDGVVTSHVRSLMPGHLVDVASTNQHNVKPWFNGRVDLSPAVPNLDSLGFPLLGGRVDYVNGRQAAVVVYGRRKHVINVYSWLAGDRRLRAPERSSDKGFNIVRWSGDGVESWAVSDVNRQELDEFVRLLTAAR